MISKEEMYDFASQIAGITDADLQQYKCGGKTKMKKDCGGSKIKLQEGKKITVKKTTQNPYSDNEWSEQTKHYTDGTTMKKTTTGDRTWYTGRKGEAPTNKEKQDSLKREYNKSEVAPIKKKK